MARKVSRQRAVCKGGGAGALGCVPGGVGWGDARTHARTHARIAAPEGAISAARRLRKPLFLPLAGLLLHCALPHQVCTPCWPDTAPYITGHASQALHKRPTTPHSAHGGAFTHSPRGTSTHAHFTVAIAAAQANTTSHTRGAGAHAPPRMRAHTQENCTPSVAAAAAAAPPPPSPMTHPGAH